MLAWLQDNVGTIIVVLSLAVIVGLVLFRVIRDRKAGKSSCGCNCASCPMHGSCHSKT